MPRLTFRAIPLVPTGDAGLGRMLCHAIAGIVRTDEHGVAGEPIRSGCKPLSMGPCPWRESLTSGLMTGWSISTMTGIAEPVAAAARPVVNLQ